MTAGDVGYIVAGIGLIAAFVDAATGLQIAKALRKVLRGKAPHLRGRKPAECGMGTLSETQVQEVTRVERFVNRHGSGDDLSGWDDVILDTVRRERAALMANRLPDAREQAGLADARAFQRRQAAEASPLDRARLAAWGAALRGESTVALPLDQHRAALEQYFGERVWRDPSEKPHLYGVRLAAKVV